MAGSNTRDSGVGRVVVDGKVVFVAGGLVLGMGMGMGVGGWL